MAQIAWMAQQRLCRDGDIRYTGTRRLIQSDIMHSRRFGGEEGCKRHGGQAALLRNEYHDLIFLPSVCWKTYLDLAPALTRPCEMWAGRRFLAFLRLASSSLFARSARVSRLILGGALWGVPCQGRGFQLVCGYYIVAAFWVTAKPHYEALLVRFTMGCWRGGGCCVASLASVLERKSGVMSRFDWNIVRRMRASTLHVIALGM